MLVRADDVAGPNHSGRLEAVQVGLLNVGPGVGVEPQLGAGEGIEVDAAGPPGELGVLPNGAAHKGAGG
eukprot:9858205-Lingulodinium_polyedra.AAC.1